MWSHATQYHEHDIFLAAPPKYLLATDYLEAAAGSSPIVTFTVTSDPPLAEDTKHTLRKCDGIAVTKRFKVESNRITFRNVRVEDTGTYVISCCNDKEQVGQETFELDVPDCHGSAQTGKS